MISNSEAFDIISNGTFYFPAYKHYGAIPQSIKCNMCNSSTLSSIGFQNFDLCLSCVDSITKYIPQKYQPSTQTNNQMSNTNSSSLDEYFMPLNSNQNGFKR